MFSTAAGRGLAAAFCFFARCEAAEREAAGRVIALFCSLRRPWTGGEFFRSVPGRLSVRPPANEAQTAGGEFFKRCSGGSIRAAAAWLGLSAASLSRVVIGRKKAQGAAKYFLGQRGAAAVSSLVSAAALSLFSGCAVTVPLGADARYGRFVAGYEPPPSLSVWGDSPANFGAARSAVPTNEK